MKHSNKIHVFWWSSIKFEGKTQDNFGDILSKYLVEKISKKKVVWKRPIKQRWNPFQKKVYFTTGSILAHVSNNCVVWGSGIISRQDKVENAVFLAVRGPETYKYLKSKNYRVSKVFGDPAMVLPQYYNPTINKGYELGIIPHYIDFENVYNRYKNDETIKIINLLNNDVEEVINEILSCKRIVSSSLHGVIVSHTYSIPAVWVEFSKNLSGDGVKFVDYFKSVNLEPYQAKFIDNKLGIDEMYEIFKNYISLPDESVIESVRENLLKVCPFKA